MFKFIWSKRDHVDNLHDPLLEGGGRDRRSRQDNRQQSRNMNQDIYDNQVSFQPIQATVTGQDQLTFSKNAGQGARFEQSKRSSIVQDSSLDPTSPMADQMQPENTFKFQMHYLMRMQKKNQPTDGRFYLDMEPNEKGKLEPIHCFAATSTIIGLTNESQLRFNIVWFVTRPLFVNFILLVIGFNSILMGCKDYLDKEDLGERNQFIEQFDPIINPIIYSECIFKIIAMGFVNGEGSYLRDGWNVLDFVVVSASAITDIMALFQTEHTENQGMQALRTFRLLRPLRLLGRIKSLKTLINTLLESMQALSATMGLACFVYTVYAIFGITVWQGALHNRCYATEKPFQLPNGKYDWIREDRMDNGGFSHICSDNYPCDPGLFCGNRYEVRKDDGSLYEFDNPNLNVDTEIEDIFWGINNYDSLGSAMITIFQVTTLDGWTPIMNFYEEADSRALSWFFYISLVVLCNFFILNLTIGQMMLKYENTRKLQRAEDYSKDPPQYDEFDSQLYKMGCQILPKEHCTGETNILKWLIHMDESVKISRDAKALVLKDQNFFRNFAEAQKQDDLDMSHPYYENSIVQLCLSVVESTSFNSFVIIVIILNTIVLAFDKYPDYDPDTGIPLLFRYLNILFTIVFTLDLVFKVIALGVGPFFNDNFNVFDLVIVVTSIYQIVLEEGGFGEKQGGFMLVLRAFRCFRVFKLFKVGDLRVLMDSQVTTMPQMLPFMLLLIFFFYIFSLIGMSFFAGKIIFDGNDQPVFVGDYEDVHYYAKRADDFSYSQGTPYIKQDGQNVTIGSPVREGFDRLGQSMLTIFQLLMGAEWRFIWYQCMRTNGKWAALYFVSVIVWIVFIMINLLMAIMLGNYDKARLFSTKKQVLEAFRLLQQEKQELNTVFDEKMNSAYFKKYVPNYHETIYRKPKYSFNRILEIIFRDEPAYLHHIQNKVLKIAGTKKKKISFKEKFKQQQENSNFKFVKIDDKFWEQKEQERLQQLESKDIDHEHTESCRFHDMSAYANSSMGIFHIDGSIRKACLCLSTELGIYNEIIHTRKRIQDRDPRHQVEKYKQWMFQGKEWGPLVPPEMSAEDRIKGTNWNSCFENFILLLIILNSIILVLDSPLNNPEGPLHKHLELMNQVFTVLFTFELIVRVIAQGIFSNQLHHVDPYLSSGWNWLDLVIVISSLIDLITSLLHIQSNKLGAIKALRSLRALRPLRVIKSQPKLKQVVNAFFSAIAAIKNILFVGGLLIVIFAIIGVSLFKGLYYTCSNDSNSIITKNDCLYTKKDDGTYDFDSPTGESWDQNDSNFDNVIQAFRSLFILTTTEGWAGMMYYGCDTVGIDMQPKQDNNPNMAIFFLCFMVVGALFVMNMFVGVVVDTFNTQKAIQRNQETDDSEINLKAFLVMKELDIIKKGMVKNVEEPKNWRQPFYRIVHNRRFENFILWIVIFNTLTMSMQVYNADPTYHFVLSTCNNIFTLIFNLEMIFKLIADQLNYFKHKWNLFDMFIVISGDIGLILSIGSTKQHQKNTMTIFRILRILRVVRLLQKFENIQVLLDALIQITPNVLHVVMLLALVMYVYALVGIYMFSKTLRRDELNSKNNFSSMKRSLLVLTRYATGEDFQEFMYEHSNTGSPCPLNPNYDETITDSNDPNFYEYELPDENSSNCDCLPLQSWKAWHGLGDTNLECGSIMAIPFFLSYQVIAGWIILNLIIAAIIDGLAMASQGREEAITNQDLHEYLELWQKFDPDLKWTIKFQDVWLFMAELHEPFHEALKKKWDPLKEPKEAWYFYHEDEEEGKSYKVRKFDCLNMIKDKNSKFKVQSKNYKVQQGSKYVERSTLFVDFKDLSQMIVKKVFIMEAAGEDAPYDPGKAQIDKKEKIKKQIEKAKTMAKISQQILSERGGHYAHDDPVHQLAAQMIQQAAKAKFDFDNIEFNLKTGGSQQRLYSKGSSKNLHLQETKFQGNIKAPQPRVTNKQGSGQNGIKTQLVKRGNTVEMKRNQFNQNNQRYGR